MSGWEWTPTDTSDIPSLAQSTGLGIPPTLVEFLLARVADLEALARAVQAETLEPDAPIGTGDDPWPSERAFAEYVTPARVLAECEAKRRIVESLRDCPTSAEFDDTRECLESVCHDLATIYADHPDYDESWRP